MTLARPIPQSGFRPKARLGFNTRVAFSDREGPAPEHTLLAAEQGAHPAEPQNPLVADTEKTVPRTHRHDLLKIGFRWHDHAAGAQTAEPGERLRQGPEPGRGRHRT